MARHAINVLNWISLYMSNYEDIEKNSHVGITLIFCIGKTYNINIQH